MSLCWTPARFGQSRAALDAWNALVSRCGAPISLAENGATAVVELADPPTSPSIGALIESGGLRAVILFDSFPFDGLFEAQIEAEDLDSLPPALRDVLIAGMIAALWRLIPQNEQPPWRLLGAGDWRDGAREIGATPVWLSVVIQGWTPQTARLRIGCVAIEIARALLDDRFAARVAWSALRTDLLVAIRFSLGPINLSLAALRRLKPGDVAVLAGGAGERVRAHLGDAIFEFRRVDASWSCGGAGDRRGPGAKERGTNMTREHLEAEFDAPASLAELVLDVDFDIGGARLTLAQIETWRPGTLVALDLPDLGGELEVTLRVGDQAIARGDLLRIDDRFAVRLTKLLLGSRSP